MAFMAGVRNRIVQPLYDSVTYAAAGQTTLRFFAVPKGQGVTAVGPGAGVKHLGDTNMDLAGTLQNPYSFLVFGFALMFAWNIPPIDIILALNGAALVLTVGSKPFLEVPARMVPSGSGPYMWGRTDALVTGTVGGTVAGNGWPSADNVFKIGREPIPLTPTESFNVELRWTAVQALSAATPITCVLHGVLKRGAQ